METSVSKSDCRWSKSVLGMARSRGLEINTEGATPTAGGMSLYVKAGPDGTSLGDCPFTHTVRMVLSEKSLPYTLLPTTPDTKPGWLIDFYGGTMPALRHRKECYVETDVIVQYLDFFFEDQGEPLSSYTKQQMRDAQDCIDGFFPRVARYLKYTGEVGDETDTVLKEELEAALGNIERCLAVEGRTGPYLVGDGENFTLLDCSLGPKLFHLMVGIGAFKENAIDMEASFPHLYRYYQAVYERPSFQEAIYPEETVVWGWTNARQSN